MKIFAADPANLGTIGGEGLGPFGKQQFIGQSSLEAVTRAISGIIGFMTVAAAIWFFFQLIIGGIGWMTAAGEKNKLNEARDRITNAFIGLIIVVAGWAILSLAGQFFGWDITLSNTKTILDQIKFQ